jgi:hypothetical protein
LKRTFVAGHEVQVELLPRQVAQLYEQYWQVPLIEYDPTGQLDRHWKLKREPQHVLQLVHLLGCSVQVAQGELQATQVEVLRLATDPEGQLT